MSANLGLDTRHRPRHVAFHARTSRACRGVMRVRSQGFADCGGASRAKGVGVGAKLRVLLYVNVMRGSVRADAREAACEEAFALPQAESHVRQTASTAMRRVRRVAAKHV